MDHSVRTRRLLLAALAVVVALAAACTGDDPSAGPATGDPPADSAGTTAGPDPCALLTGADITGVTGWALAPGEQPTEVDVDGVEVCNHQDRNRTALVQVQIAPGAGRAGFDARVAEATALDPADPPVPVELTGATAAVDEPDHGAAVLLAGDDVVVVSVLGDPAGADHHLDLARLVAGRLA